MRVVTTCHKAGFEEYGHRCLESLHKWPDGTQFIWYTEGYKLPDAGVKVEERDIRTLLPLVNLKDRLRHYEPPGWQWDVVKFAHKIVAAVDALADEQERYGGVGVWLDADCVTHQPIPAGYVESLLRNKYFACFRRRGLYTETGFWVVDCAHEHHREIFKRWESMLEDDRFEGLQQWHDCVLLDAVIKPNERAGLIEVENLSGEFDREMHPMARVELARYIDHCKGPRKAAGISPENKFREAA